MIREESACGQKVKYDTKADARRVRKRMFGRGHVDGKLNAYRCQFCGWWHLGHMPQAVRNGQLNKASWKRTS